MSAKVSSLTVGARSARAASTGRTRSKRAPKPRTARAGAKARRPIVTRAPTAAERRSASENARRPGERSRSGARGRQVPASAGRAESTILEREWARVGNTWCLLADGHDGEQHHGVTPRPLPEITYTKGMRNP